MRCRRIFKQISAADIPKENTHIARYFVGDQNGAYEVTAEEFKDKKRFEGRQMFLPIGQQIAERSKQYISPGARSLPLSIADIKSILNKLQRIL